MSERERPPHALVELSLARLRSFYREPGVVFWSFGFPILLSLALGVAFRNRPEEVVPVAVVEGERAAPLAEALDALPELEARVLDEAQARAALRTSKVALVVEPTSPPSYRFDPSRPESRLARALVDDALQRDGGRRDAFEAHLEPVLEPGSRYVDFLVPGLVGVGLMQGGLWGVGYVIVEMRTRKLLKRFLATPMKKRDFLLAFVLVRSLFLLVELPVLLGFATLVFGVPLHGSVVTLLGVALLGGISFAGLGLLVASRAQNVQTASGLINLASMPMFLASGTFFSSARFPDVVQPMIRLLPLTALNDALRAVMLEGAGASAIARPVVVLAAWGFASFALALRLFRWR